MFRIYKATARLARTFKQQPPRSHNSNNQKRLAPLAKWRHKGGGNSLIESAGHGGPTGEKKKNKNKSPKMHNNETGQVMECVPITSLWET